MDPQKVDMFMMTNNNNFPQEQALIIRNRLLQTDDSKWGMISSLQFKNPTTALILSILLGELGVDRFYIGDTGMGVGKLLTAGGCGVWAIIDWFLISKATREKNYAMLCSVL